MKLTLYPDFVGDPVVAERVLDCAGKVALILGRNTLYLEVTCAKYRPGRVLRTPDSERN
jgi:hypothetical protein